jgi:hypothetical protein
VEWRVCPNWPEYEVSERGDIRRIVMRFGKIGLRKPYVGSNGRLLIVMRHHGLRRACHISRLVLEAFVGPSPSDTHQGAHNDGDPFNNHWKNLRWATPSENQMDRVAHGTSNRGERFGRARLTEEQVREIRYARHIGESSHDVGPRFGVAASTVRSIWSRKSWFWLEDDALAILDLGIKRETK